MDIVERLRRDADALENGPYTSIKEAREVMREAAAEIERLRDEAVAQWMDPPPDSEFSGYTTISGPGW